MSSTTHVVKNEDVGKAARGRLGRWVGVVASLAAFGVMLATESRLAIVWDEGYTLTRVARVRAWFEALRDPGAFARDWRPGALLRLEDRIAAPSASQLDTRGELFAPATLAWFWPFAREEPHGHPPLYALVGLVGDLVAPGWTPLARARLGSMLVFSAAAGVLAGFCFKRWGLWSAVGAAGAWSLHPHLFALAHYATYDGLVASLWLIATLLFASIVEPIGARGRGPWAIGLARIVFGVVLGCAMATKLTGWLLVLPLGVWALLLRRPSALMTLRVGCAVGVLVFVVVCPPLWVDPFGGLMRFIESNLGRAKTIPIKTQFLGHIYETPTGSLPWYNTLVWLWMSTPVVVLLLSAVGLWSAVRGGRDAAVGRLLVLSGVFLWVLRALPHTPGHDGTRQLAVGMGGLAPLVGLGIHAMIGWSTRVGRWLAALCLIENGVSVLIMMPVPLAYFSPLCGGLPGATALGMEPTYYWDAMAPEAMDRLNDRAQGDGSVWFASNPTAWYYRESGALKAGLYPFEGSQYGWYVVQNRPGAFGEVTRRLVSELGDSRGSVIFEKLGIPLVWAYRAADVERVARGATSVGVGERPSG